MWLRWVCIMILTYEVQLGWSLLCHLVKPLAVARVLHIVHYSTVCVVCISKTYSQSTLTRAKHLGNLQAK